MSIYTFSNPQSGDDGEIAAVRSFFAEHGEALANGACLLGGDQAVRDCIRLASSLRHAKSLQRSDILDLIGLHRLYMLEHVGDPDRIETALFSAISPNDPRVHDLCHMADRLRELLEQIAEFRDDKETVTEILRNHIAA